MRGSGRKTAALSNRGYPQAGSRRFKTAPHALARRPARAYPAGGHPPGGEPAGPIPIGASSSAVQCNKIFKTPSSQGGSKSMAQLRSSQRSHYCTTIINGLVKPLPWSGYSSSLLRALRPSAPSNGCLFSNCELGPHTGLVVAGNIADQEIFPGLEPMTFILHRG